MSIQMAHVQYMHIGYKGLQKGSDGTCTQCFSLNSRDKAMLNDSSKQLASDVELPLGKPREKLILLKHVAKHAYKQILRQGRERGRRREGGREGGREGERQAGERRKLQLQQVHL